MVSFIESKMKKTFEGPLAVPQVDFAVFTEKYNNFHHTATSQKYIETKNESVDLLFMIRTLTLHDLNYIKSMFHLYRNQSVDLLTGFFIKVTLA